jgi:hypothetical protein
MTAHGKPGSSNPANGSAEKDKPGPARRLPLPGMAAICLYLFLLAGVIILGVVGGQHYPAVFLLFAAVFITAAAGLIMSFRWAWSLALAAVFLITGYNLWLFSTERQWAALIQGLLNLVFFLYLIRPEVRDTLH